MEDKKMGFSIAKRRAFLEYFQVIEKERKGGAVFIHDLRWPWECYTKKNRDEIIHAAEEGDQISQALLNFLTIDVGNAWHLLEWPDRIRNMLNVLVTDGDLVKVNSKSGTPHSWKSVR